MGLYDLILKELKRKEYSRETLRQDLRYFRFTDKKIAELERDLIFQGKLKKIKRNKYEKV
jgi:hypothetical protein